MSYLRCFTFLAAYADAEPTKSLTAMSDDAITMADSRGYSLVKDYIQ